LRLHNNKLRLLPQGFFDDSSGLTFLYVSAAALSVRAMLCLAI
jgi:hypothetical protein